MKLNFKIFRYFAASGEKRIDHFEIDQGGAVTVLDTLLYIRDTIDPTLVFDHVCSNGICGSCAMLINLKPRLACRTLLEDCPGEIRLHPLPNFLMLGDLSVDTSRYFENQRKQNKLALVSSSKNDIEYYTHISIENEKMMKIHELERCIECGCCIASCPTVMINPEFAGPYALASGSRFLLDPRDDRSSYEWYEVFGTDEGMFGCSSVLACDSYCPKSIPLASTLAHFRRSILRGGVMKK